MTAPIEIQSLSHDFGTFRALSGIDLRIEAGEYITLLGPSGCGKTTLLSILGGFLDPTEGRVLIGGRDMTHVPPARRPTTTMFQDYALFPHMTLRDNVGFGPRMAGMGRAARNAKADELLDLVGLGGAGDKRPHELSGGQRQRVALARALAVDPDVLLLDEPLGALDLKLRRAMQDELKAIQRRVGTTFVHVTHDQEEAMAIADRIVVMNAGRVEQADAPRAVYLRPATLFVAGFMGEVNRIPVRAGQSPLGPVGTGDGTLLIRPEAFATGAGLPLGRGTVRDTTFFGTHVRAHVVPDAAQDLTLVVHLPPGSDAAPGASIDLYAETHLMLEET